MEFQVTSFEKCHRVSSKIHWVTFSLRSSSFSSPLSAFLLHPSIAFFPSWLEPKTMMPLVCLSSFKRKPLHTRVKPEKRFPSSTKYKTWQEMKREERKRKRKEERRRISWRWTMTTAFDTSSSTEETIILPSGCLKWQMSFAAGIFRPHLSLLSSSISLSFLR